MFWKRGRESLKRKLVFTTVYCLDCGDVNIVLYSRRFIDLSGAAVRLFFILNTNCPAMAYVGTEHYKARFIF